LAYQTSATSLFASACDLRYVIDPMTLFFQALKSDIINEKGDQVKASLRKLLEQYVPSLEEDVRNLAFASPMDLIKKVGTAAFCENVMRFQKLVVSGEIKQTGAGKYLVRKGIGGKEPQYFVPPYFAFEAHGDQGYKLSLECANQSRAESRPLAPIICLNPKRLSDGQVQAIADDYSLFDACIIWFDTDHEIKWDVDDIVKVRKLVKALGSRLKVISLYGGFRTALLSFDGLSALSHGILYTEHKMREMLPGGGGVAERYYLPRLHEFRSLAQAELILKRIPKLFCHCDVCESSLGGNPNRLKTASQDPDFLRSHFLAVRRTELDNLQGRSREDFVSELRLTYETFHSSVSALDNPDAMYEKRSMVGLENLMRWADALSARIV
jgi:hypothetical protein